MCNRRKSVLDPTTQVLFGRFRTQAEGLMSAFPHAEAVNVCEVRTAPDIAGRQVSLEEAGLLVGPTGQSHPHADRLADLIHAKSAVCHDLRQYLTVLVANIEFLYEADSAHLDKDDIYREIKVASEQMTDLIDSLGGSAATARP
jgi:hypothetical protein